MASVTAYTKAQSDSMKASTDAAVGQRYTKPTGGIPTTDFTPQAQSAITAAASAKPAPGATVLLDDGSAVRWDGVRPINPNPELVGIGHSLMYSSNGVIESKIANLLGAAVVNQGIGGQTSSDIAIRKGALVPLLTLAGGQIPADTTSVAVTAMSPGSSAFRKDGGGSYSFNGTLAGVAGTLTETITSSSGAPTWTFARVPQGPQPLPRRGRRSSSPRTARPTVWLFC